MQEFTFMARQQLRGRVSVSVSGSLDNNTVDEFNENMRSLPESAKSVSIDLSGVTNISSAGIGALASRSHELIRNGLSVYIIHPSPQVARLLHHANLDGILKQE